MNYIPLLFKELPCPTLSVDKKAGLAYATAHKLGWSIAPYSEGLFVAFAVVSETNEEDIVMVEIYPEKINVAIAGVKGEDNKEDKTYDNIDIFIKEFELQKDSLTESQMLEKFNELLTLKVDDEQEPKTFKEKAEEFFGLFVPKKNYIITPIIVYLNCIVFGLMMLMGVDFFTPNPQDLINWGANFLPLTLAGEWWRLLTSCFLHSGIFHLAFNMYALVYVGVLLEAIIGAKKFIVAYLLTGLAASITSLFWHHFSAGVGASGAIFGMYGVFIALLTTKLIDKNVRMPLLSSMGVFVGYNILMGFKENIDNAAHIGGLISGIIIGYGYYLLIFYKLKGVKQLAAMTSLIALFVMGSAFAMSKLPKDMLYFNQYSEDFQEAENEAILTMNSMDSIPEIQQFFVYEKKVIKNWEKCVEATQSIKDLKISDDLMKRNEALLEYSNYRLGASKLIYKTLKEKTDIYTEEINEINLKIDSLFEANNFGQGE